MEIQEIRDVEENIACAMTLFEYLKKHHVVDLANNHNKALIKAINHFNLGGTNIVTTRDALRAIAGDDYEVYTAPDKDELIMGNRNLTAVTAGSILTQIGLNSVKTDKSERDRFMYLINIAVLILFKEILRSSNIDGLMINTTTVQEWDQKINQTLTDLAENESKSSDDDKPNITFSDLSAQYNSMTDSKNSVRKNRFVFLKLGIVRKLLERNGYVIYDEENERITATDFLRYEMQKYLDTQNTALASYVDATLEGLNKNVEN